MGKTLTSSKTYIPSMGDDSDPVDFQAVELERFLDAYFKGEFVEGEPENPGKLFFTGWQEQWTPLVSDHTLRGLEKGVRRYVHETCPGAISIYQTDIGQLIYFSGLAEEVAGSVGQLSFINKDELSFDRRSHPTPNHHKRNIGFAQEVSECYAHFLTNDSIYKLENGKVITS